MEEVMGIQVGDVVRKMPHLAEDACSRMKAGIAQVRSGSPPRTVECWAVSERFQGIQRAGLVVVNVRDPAERPVAEQLLVDLARLRKDAGRKKAVARVRKAIRSQASELPSVASG
jgi:hypothetical protein